MSSFLDAIADRVLVCDGAMGTMLYAKGVFVNQSFDALNVSNPDLVEGIHRAYREAGADVLETNTFGLGDRLTELNLAGVRLARRAAARCGGRTRWTNHAGRGRRVLSRAGPGAA